MRAIDNFVHPDSMKELIEDVLRAYDPLRNQIDLSSSRLVHEFADPLGKVLGLSLRYLSSYLLLVSETTIETVNDSASGGWHIDGTCAEVEGDCYNLWLPLYVSSANSGVEVISAQENPEFYRMLGGPLKSLTILDRARVPHLVERLGSGAETDFIFSRDGTAKAVFVSSQDLVVRRLANPNVGDVAAFKQTEVHRGFHDGGVRIQLSLKYLGPSAKRIQEIAPVPAPRHATKHGRLEACLVRELLRVQLATL